MSQSQLPGSVATGEKIGYNTLYHERSIALIACNGFYTSGQSSGANTHVRHAVFKLDTLEYLSTSKMIVKVLFSNSASDIKTFLQGKFANVKQRARSNVNTLTNVTLVPLYFV